MLTIRGHALQLEEISISNFPLAARTAIGRETYVNNLEVTISPYEACRINTDAWRRAPAPAPSSSLAVACPRAPVLFLFACRVAKPAQKGAKALSDSLYDTVQ